MSEHAKDELKALVREAVLESVEKAVGEAVTRHCRFSDTEAARLHLTAGMSQEQIEALHIIAKLQSSQLSALSRLARALDTAADRVGHVVVLALAFAAAWVVWKLIKAGLISP